MYKSTVCGSYSHGGIGKKGNATITQWSAYFQSNFSARIQYIERARVFVLYKPSNCCKLSTPEMVLRYCCRRQPGVWVENELPQSAKAMLNVNCTRPNICVTE